MLSCPFLKRVSSSMIHSEPLTVLANASKCPIFTKLISRQKTTLVQSMGTPVSVESKTTTEISEQKRCPFLNVTESLKQEDSSIVDNVFEIASVQLGSGVVAIPKKCPFHATLEKSGHVAAPNAKKTADKMAETAKDVNAHAKQQLKPFTSPLTGVNKPSVTFDYKRHFEGEIARKQADNTYRVFKRVLRCADQFPYAEEHSFDQRKVAVWCSNDYLGMSWHPEVMESAVKAIRKHGVGSGGTRNISGNTILHEKLETELADLHGKEAALVFTSCYVANEAALYTLGQRLPGVQIYSDSGNHASMIHGIRTSQAPKHIFRHNDSQHLEELLTTNGVPGAPKVVAFETVHSMTGDVCPLDDFLTITERHGGLSFVDEVHAVGLYGDQGAGVAQRDNCMHRIDAITGTLGKAYANVGGYLAGNRELVDMIRSYAAGFIFTTSLPPSVLAAARTAIQILRSDEGRQLRETHQERVTYIREGLKAEGLPVIDCPSHIIPVHVGEPALCTELSNQLLRDYNIYVQSINYPTVGKGEERLRIAPTPHHTKELSDKLIFALKSIWLKNSIPLQFSQTKSTVAAGA